MLNPDNIRNASFSLLPTGYAPEQVDAALNAVAEKVASGEDASQYLTTISFELIDVGYDPTEVDEFFGTLSDTFATPDIDADVAADETEPKDAPEPISDLIAEDEDDATSAVDEDDAALFANAPDDVSWEAPANGVLDLQLLCQAVDRTGETLASLRGFIDNEIGAMKLAVERQAQETAKRCGQLLAEASAEARALTDAANAEIERARNAAERQAERDRRDLAKELKQKRETCEAEVTQLRSAANEYAATVRAEAERDRAEAQKTIENAISMQASIAESLERARQQLTPTSEDLAA